MKKGTAVLDQRSFPNYQPEHWQDHGCEVSDSCFACPLPRCKHDDPAWYAAYRQAEKERQIAEAVLPGVSKLELARRFGASTRTVSRALARARGAA